jgi:hypothetical protein
VLGLFFFAESVVVGIVYLDVLEWYFMPILQEEVPEDVLFQQDGVPPHFHHEVKGFLNHHFPGKWIGRSKPVNWPSHLFSLTPLNVFLWGYIKDAVSVTSLAIILLEFAKQMFAVVTSVTSNLFSSSTVCGLNLHTNVVSAMPHALICKIEYINLNM